MTRIAQTGRDLIDYVAQILSGINMEDMSEAKDFVISQINDSVVPMYAEYKDGDESKKLNLEEAMWYHDALTSIDDESWNHILIQALDPEFSLAQSELDTIVEEPEVSMSDIQKNLDIIKAPVEETQRRPVEKIMVKPPQGTIKEPAGVGSFVYSRDEGSEGQIKEILSEDKIKVINSKNNKEEVWSTENLHLSNKTR
jgi:hypothetical protein